MSTQFPPAARAYLARVRTALADLPTSEVDEIVDDVRPQLLEIAEDLGDALSLDTIAERLGSPEAYAAELRAAGDYPPPPSAEQGAAAKTRVFGARLALWVMVLGALAAACGGFGVAYGLEDDALVVLVFVIPVVAAAGWYVWARGTAKIRALPEVDKLRSSMAAEPGTLRRYLASLRPAWWLLCAVVLVGVGLLLVVKTGGSAFLWLALFVALAAVAVWAGPRSRTDRRLLWASLPLSALVAGGVLGLGGYAFEAADTEDAAWYGYQPAEASYETEDTLGYEGTTLDNVYAFDSEGKPIKEFYLYTEDGKPLTTTRYGCDPSTGTRAPSGADNRFPHPRVTERMVDEHGNVNGYNAYRSVCDTTKKIPFTAAIPK